MKKLAALVLIVPLMLAGCDETEAPKSTSGSRPGGDVLKAHSALFKKEVISPVDGVHVAIGYGLANSIMIEGDDGVIIVDTMEGKAQAREVLAAFRRITHKPVKAIVLTHNHTDHIYGASVFAEGRDVPVYAHRTTGFYIDKIVNVLVNSIYARSMRMFGPLLPPAAVVNAGIGPALNVDTTDLGLMRPSVVFDDELEVEIAGIRLKLVHAPGETEDQLFVWLPEREILLPGDNIYQTFPNLYTIRGTAYRDVMKWVRSLDKMRELRPEVLVPSHTRPLTGADQIDGVLLSYRDAIQYVHDQTVRGMNRGLGPDDLVDFVQLPDHLASHPWLIEHYGTVAWSVRSVFSGYLGWFGGDGVDLEPLRPRERSARLVQAFRTSTPLPDQARAAYDRGDFQWAAELARHWLNTEPDSDDAKKLLASALESKAEDHINPNALHWYLTQAGELRGDLEVGKPVTSNLSDEILDTLPIGAFMAGMTTRLKAEDALELDTVVQFDFQDIGQSFTVHVRRGVAALAGRAADNPDVLIKTTAATWKRLATQKRNPAMAFAAGEVDVDGGIIEVVKFLTLFER